MEVQHKDPMAKVRLYVSIAEALNVLRIMPRIALGTFMFLLYDTLQWYMTLEKMDVYQAGVLGALLTSAPFWFKFYVDSGNTGDN